MLRRKQRVTPLPDAPVVGVDDDVQRKAVAREGEVTSATLASFTTYRAHARDRTTLVYGYGLVTAVLAWNDDDDNDDDADDTVC